MRREFVFAGVFLLVVSILASGSFVSLPSGAGGAQKFDLHCYVKVSNGVGAMSFEQSDISCDVNPSSLLGGLSSFGIFSDSGNLVMSAGGFRKSASVNVREFSSEIFHLRISGLVRGSYPVQFTLYGEEGEVLKRLTKQVTV